MIKPLANSPVVVSWLAVTFILFLYTAGKSLRCIFFPWYLLSLYLTHVTFAAHVLLALQVHLQVVGKVSPFIGAVNLRIDINFVRSKTIAIFAALAYAMRWAFCVGECSTLTTCGTLANKLNFQTILVPLKKKKRRKKFCVCFERFGRW